MVAFRSGSIALAEVLTGHHKRRGDIALRSTHGQHALRPETWPTEKPSDSGTANGYSSFARMRRPQKKTSSPALPAFHRALLFLTVLPAKHVA